MSIAIREFDRCIEQLWKYGGGGVPVNQALRALEKIRNSYSDLIEAAKLGWNGSYGTIEFDEHAAQRLRNALAVFGSEVTKSSLQESLDAPDS